MIVLLVMTTIALGLVAYCTWIYCKRRKQDDLEKGKTDYVSFLTYLFYQSDFQKPNMIEDEPKAMENVANEDPGTSWFFGWNIQIKYLGVPEVEVEQERMPSNPIKSKRMRTDETQLDTQFTHQNIILFVGQ